MSKQIEAIVRPMPWINRVLGISEEVLDSTIKIMLCGIDREFEQKQASLSHAIRISYLSLRGRTGLSDTTIEKSLAFLVEKKAIVRSDPLPEEIQTPNFKEEYIRFTSMFIDDPRKLMCS